MPRWPTGLVTSRGFLLLLFPRQCARVLISSSPVASCCSKTRIGLMCTNPQIRSETVSNREEGASSPTATIQFSALTGNGSKLTHCFNFTGTKWNDKYIHLHYSSRQWWKTYLYLRHFCIKMAWPVLNILLRSSQMFPTTFKSKTHL